MIKAEHNITNSAELNKQFWGCCPGFAVTELLACHGPHAIRSFELARAANLGWLQVYPRPEVSCQVLRREEPVAAAS